MLAMGVLNQIKGGFYSTSVMRGATKSSFVIARIMIYIATWFVFFESFWLASIIIGIDTTGWQALGLVFCVA